MTSLRYEVADRRRTAASDIWLRWEVLLLVLLAAVMVINSRLSPWFLDYYNLLDSTFNFSEKAIMALAMTLIIVTRDIDLSVASIVALASVFMGLAAQAGAGVPLLVLIGLSLFAVQFLLLFLAFRHGMPPGLASVTQQTHVFLTVLLAALLFGERPTARQGLGMTLAAAGLALVGLTVGADLPALALALALSGALSWAVGNLLLKHVRGVPMFPLIAWCSLVPPAPMLLLSALWGDAPLPAAVAGAPWASLGAVLFLGAATWAYAIWGRLLGRYPAAVVAPLALLSPVTGVVASALVFGEQFTPLLGAGGRVVGFDRTAGYIVRLPEEGIR